MSNQEKLRNNSAHLPAQGAPREGGALLAGLLLCGRCGRRMSPHYESVDHARSRWIYQCHQEDEGVRVRCWSVTGPRIDAEIESLFLSMMVPGEIELSLAVERETDRQAESLEKAWRARLEQARFEARTAERRYMAVDPDNRVVARTLEAQWEQRLRDLATVERQLQDARTSHKVQLNDADRARIRELARDLPAIWRSATTAVADRKAMLRIAIEVISARPVEIPTRSTRLEVQWHTGTTSSVVVPRFRRGEYKKTHASVEDQVRDLAAAGTHDAAIAEELNRLGHRNGAGGAWTVDNIRHLRGSRRIPRVAPDLLRMPPLPPRDASGRYSVPGAATRMGVTEDTVYRWIRQGRVTSIRADHGTHRAPYWIELDDAVEARLRETMRGGRPKKSVD